MISLFIFKLILHLVHDISKSLFPIDVLFDWFLIFWAWRIIIIPILFWCPFGVSVCFEIMVLLFIVTLFYWSLNRCQDHKMVKRVTIWRNEYISFFILTIIEPIKIEFRCVDLTDSLFEFIESWITSQAFIINNEARALIYTFVSLSKLGLEIGPLFHSCCNVLVPVNNF